MDNSTPRVVRNFWIEGKVDGQESKILGGPQAADGGFKLTILIRDKGKISEEKVIVEGEVEDGVLYLRAFPESQPQMGFEVLSDR